MTWSWRCYIPLVEHEPNPDVAHLLGARAVVEVLEETHYAVSTAIDLCRIRRLDSPEYEDDVMELRIRAAHHFSAGVECWVARPRYRLKCGPDASPETALAEANEWLKRQSIVNTAMHTGPMARSHAIPTAEPVEQLRSLADGTLRPRHIIIRRRRLKCAVPNEEGVLIDQSDLEAESELYRSVGCEGANALNVRRVVGHIKQLFLGRGIAPGVLAAPPLFLRTLMQAEGEAGESIRPPVMRSQQTTAAPKAKIAAVSPAAHSASLLGSGGLAGQSPKPPARLTDDAAAVHARLLDAWRDSSDAFALRLHHAAQQHPPCWPPPEADDEAGWISDGDEADEQTGGAGAPPPPASSRRLLHDATSRFLRPPLVPPPRLPEPPPHVSREHFPTLTPAVPMALTGARAWSHADEGWTADANMALRDCFDALEGAQGDADYDAYYDGDEEAALEAAERRTAARAAAREAERRAAAQQRRLQTVAPYGPQSGYGLLAQYPPSVVRHALGEAAAAGDVRHLEQLLVASRGAHLNAACGVLHDARGRDAGRQTALHLAAAAGHAACVQLLLRHRAEAQATAEGGRTALHLAAEGGGQDHAECCRLLLRYGCGALVPDLVGCTPVDYAAAAAHHLEDATACDELLAPHAAPSAIRSEDKARHPSSAAERHGFGGPMRYRLDSAAAAEDRRDQAAMGGRRAAWVGPLVVAP